MKSSPGYKATEIGILPVEWGVATIGALANPVRGASPRPAGDPRYFNGSFKPWLTVAALTNLADEDIYVRVTDTSLTELGAKHSRELPSGTVIIANSGATLGVAKLLAIDCCANDGVAALLQLDREVCPEFVVYCINSMTKFLRETVATGNGQPNLNTDLIGQLRIPRPPVHEQRAIAAALLDVDASIAALSRFIGKKRNLRQGVTQRLLTGETRLPGFTAQWIETKLSDLGRFLKGGGVRRDDAQSGDLPCVRYGEIYTTHHNVVCKFTSHVSRAVADAATRIQRGDLLFAASGETKEEIGKCVAIAEDVEAYAGGDIIILRPASGDPVFLGNLLNIPEIARQKANRGQGDAVVHISAAALGAISVKLPRVDEQRAIGRVISDWNSDLFATEARLEKTRALKQAMMHSLLTGRVRLPIAREAAPKMKEAAYG